MTEAKTPFEWNTAEQLVKTPQREPYDPEPRPLEKATNGFVMCRGCDQVVQLPHDCAGPSLFGLKPQKVSLLSLWSKIKDATERAERAESMLNVLAFDHAVDLLHEGEIWMAARKAQHCVFCAAYAETLRPGR